MASRLSRIERLLLDRPQLDPLIALGVVAISLYPATKWGEVSDHSSFFQSLTGLLVGFLTLAVLAITISLSRDLSRSVRTQLKTAGPSVVWSLFASLGWLVFACLLSVGAYLLDVPQLSGFPLTGYVLFVVALALVPVCRVGLFLARLYSNEMAARD